MVIRAGGVGVLLLAMAAAPAAAAPLPRYGMFVYSSLCRDRATQDLNGDRLVLVRLPQHDFGYVESGQGRLFSIPMQDISIENGVLSYRHQDSDETNPSPTLKTAQGTITAEDVGMTDSDGKPFRLKRQVPLADDIPVCR